MNNIILSDIINILSSKNIININDRMNNININNLNIITYNISDFNKSFFFCNFFHKKICFMKTSHLLSFYYYLYIIIYNLDDFNIISEDKIINLINKLILNINTNSGYFKYISNKCKKSVLIDFIENYTVNEFVLQYITELLSVNIVVFDCEIEKFIIYYNNEYLDIYNNFYIFSKFNNEYVLLLDGNNNYIFKYKEISYIFNDLNICQRCNLNFKKGHTVFIKNPIFYKYLNSSNDNTTLNKIIKQPIECKPNDNTPSTDNNNLSIIKELLKTNLKKITLKYLQEIATKIDIAIIINVNNKKKRKTKQQLYDEINNFYIKS